MNKNFSKHIKIFDTTLRDGEQMPGVVFTPEQKTELAQKFSEFGVDIIDVMPVVSEQEKITVKTIANMGLKSEISASCRLKKEDIDVALNCDIKRITLFTPLSDLHLEYKLRISREENLIRTISMIDYARDHGLKVDFAGEDSTRADRNYLIDFINQISDKIEIFFVADTLGCLTPPQTYELIRNVKKNCKCLLGLHGHNDFAQSTANTLEGLRTGADVFSGTFTGIGERAGNAPIEEVCVGLKFLYGVDLGVKFEKITEICRLVERYSGVWLQNHKPLVGRNAFAHESGIHADGVIKHPRTYENFDPEFIGQKRRFIFGKHTGRSVLKYVLGNVSDEELMQALNRIKILSESKKMSFSEEDVVNLFEMQRRMNGYAVKEVI
jgi:isopropylmalate/homocitrate/citramalate synthase